MNQIPAQPVDMVMPVAANQLFTVATFAILLIVALVLLRECRQVRSPLPLLFLVGGMLGVFTEPFFDLMVCAWYPRGVTTVVEAFNVRVPLWLIAPWGFYIGGQAWFVYKAFVGGIQARTLLWLFPLFWVTNVAFEIPGLLLGVYTYYGPQAFEVLGFPLWMGMSNALMPISIAAAIYALRDVLHGPRVWLAVPVVPLAGLASGAAVGFPMWFALNAGFDLAGTRLATLAVFGCACLILYVYASRICLPAPQGTYAHA